MLPAIATVNAMETRLGVEADSLADADLARAQTALEDASVLVRHEANRTWVGADGVTITAPDVVVTVVLQAALRVYRNPDGFQGESVGDYSSQFSSSAVGVYLTDDEVRIVKQAARGPQSAMTLRTPSAYEAPADPAAAFWDGVL